MQLTTEDLAPVDGVVVRPAGLDCATGVLVLSGSSGRVERDRASVLAGAGVTALTYRWFGAPGQPHGIWELPLTEESECVGFAVYPRQSLFNHRESHTTSARRLRAAPDAACRARSAPAD